MKSCNCAESFLILKRTFLEFSEGICQKLNVFIRKITMDFVYHVSHITRINKYSLSLLLLVAANKPQGNRDGNTIEQVGRKCHDTFYQVILNNFLSYLSLSTGLCGQSTICKHKPNLSVWSQMMNHMLNPCIVRIT